MDSCNETVPKGGKMNDDRSPEPNRSTILEKSDEYCPAQHRLTAPLAPRNGYVKCQCLFFLAFFVDTVTDGFFLWFNFSSRAAGQTHCDSLVVVVMGLLMDI